MRTLAFLAFFPSFVANLLPAQEAGLRGATQEAPQVVRLEVPDAVTAERVITIEGVAAVRVAPTSLRLVFAVSATAETPSAASVAVREQVAAAQGRLRSVAERDRIDVDFIAAVPVFAWGVEGEDGKRALVERTVGTRVQYNLCVTVPDEAAALAAIEAAASVRGIDVLAVDYWNEQLAAKQVEAQQQALAAAQQKAKLLLSVFPAAPHPINVHENTRVLFPQQLYQKLTRAEDSAALGWSRDELPRVPASRPLQVYYRGLFANLDIGATAMPGKREIEVVSTVRLYFAAPERPVVMGR